MACCILGALIISQLLAFRRVILGRLRQFWTVSMMVGVFLLSMGAERMAQAMAQSDLSPVRVMMWCLSGGSRPPPGGGAGRNIGPGEFYHKAGAVKTSDRSDR